MVKGLIIAAGYGTRFLPATKTVPKEMFPLLTKPSILFIVEEMVQSGIQEIVFVSSRRKKVLEDYFDREIELETAFLKEGATKKLEKLATPKCSIAFVRQEEMKGTGHAMLSAAPFLGDSPFVMAFPDDIFLGEPPLSKQLIDVYNKTGCSVLALFQETGDVSRYGVAEVEKQGDILRVKCEIEKPPKGTEPSKLVSYGRFLFTPDIFPHLRETFARFQGKEFYHVEGINKLAEEGKVVGHCYTNPRLDTGEPMGYVKAIIDYTLTQEDCRQEMLDYMKQKVAEQK